MWMYNKQLQERGESSPQKVAAWLTDDRKWPKRDLPLKVSFMKNCPEEWKYHKDEIDSKKIMEILQGSWPGCFTTTSPWKFQSDIRVDFKGMIHILLSRGLLFAPNSFSLMLCPPLTCISTCLFFVCLFLDIVWIEPSWGVQQ